MIGFGLGTGQRKAADAAEAAISSPLLEASISGARRAICAVTCGMNVSLYEAEECVQRIIEQAGNAIDIKFGVSINENLDDMILVSVIASDFTEEYDFTSVPTFTPLRREPMPSEEEPKPSEPSLEPGAPEEGGEEESTVSAILPGFLRGKIGNH